MEIEGISTEFSLGELPSAPKAAAPEKSFGDMMNESINELNRISNKAGQLSDQLAAGENVELHDVMIAAQEADVAMRLAVQLRNKALDAYREMIRMPV